MSIIPKHKLKIYYAEKATSCIVISMDMWVMVLVAVEKKVVKFETAIFRYFLRIAKMSRLVDSKSLLYIDRIL